LPVARVADGWRLPDYRNWSAALAWQEILFRPDLLNELGLPRAVQRALKQRIEPTPAAVRAMRFDFHPTKDDWSISEVNSDLPGGFTEASFFTGLMAQQFSGARPA